MEKREIKILIILSVAVIIIILAIYFFRKNGNLDEEIIKCIASKSLLIAKKDCGTCAYQKQILGNYTSYFDIIDIIEYPEIVEQYNLIKVPTWIIDGKKYTGVKTLKDLKKITGC